MSLTKEIERRLGVIGTRAVDAARLLPVAAKYYDEPAAATKAARDLTPKEAFDLLMHLLVHGQIALTEPVRIDGKGRLTYPAQGQRLTAVPVIAGVEFYRASATANEKNGSLKGAYRAKSFQPDPAFAVVLFRLAKALKEKWTATRIVWGGIGQGHDNKPHNCHDAGTCFDFYGAVTGRGSFDVAFDWALKPVYRPNSKDHSRWKDTERQTFYRLRGGVDDPAYSFFKDVYDFATRECTDAGSSPTIIGNRSSIIHPDHPEPSLRNAHQEHMHMQVGPAFF